MFPENEENIMLARRISLNQLDDCFRFPKYFEIETIHACNARCVMCTINQWERHDDPLMKESLFIKFVEEIKDYSDWIETVCLNRDGEPTLDKNLPIKIRMLKEAGIKKVTLSTNGQLLVPELSKELISSGLDDIMLSIDSIRKDTFEKIRKGLNFEEVLNNTLKLIKARNNACSDMTIRIRMVIIDENKAEVDEWIRYWSDKIGENDKAYAMPMHTWGNQLKPEGKEMIDNYANKPCVSLFSSIAMHSNGKIGLCAADYNTKVFMGDFTKQSIKEIWQGEAYTKFREMHANGRRNELPLCRGCHIWDREYRHK